MSTDVGPDPKPAEEELARLRRMVQDRDALLRSALAAQGRVKISEMLRARALAHQEHQESQLDSVTRTLGYSGLVARITFELDRSRRSVQTCGLIAAELLHLASINRERGVTFGDTYLATAAHSLAQLAAKVRGRPAVLGRLSGSRFGLLLPDARFDDVSRLAELLYQELRYLLGAKADLPAAVGCTLGPTEQDTAASFIERARAGLTPSRAQGHAVVQPLPGV